MSVASRVQRHSERYSWEFAHWTHLVIRILYQLKGSDELKGGKGMPWPWPSLAGERQDLAGGFPVWEGQKFSFR
jgi:hypothetical protein